MTSLSREQLVCNGFSDGFINEVTALMLHYVFSSVTSTAEAAANSTAESKPLEHHGITVFGDAKQIKMLSHRTRLRQRNFMCLRL